MAHNASVWDMLVRGGGVMELPLVGRVGHTTSTPCCGGSYCGGSSGAVAEPTGGAKAREVSK